MEETGLIQQFLRWFLRIPVLMFTFSLGAVLCLPFALGEIVRGMNTSLLVFASMIGMLVAAGLATRKTSRFVTALSLLGIGPLGLFVQIGDMWSSIFMVFKHTVSMDIAVVFQKSIDIPSLLLANDELTIKVLGLAERINTWLVGLLHGIQIEDPLVRTLVWSLCMWLLAVWAGWQIVRYERFLIGILPTTAVLAVILDYTRGDATGLWMHLILLLSVIGFTQFGRVRMHWLSSGIDYSDSTIQESLFVVGLLTLQLLALSYFASTLSVKDILEAWRERTTSSNTSQAETLGLEPGKASSSSIYASRSSPIHRIEAGPDLSDEIVMTVSTGDLPSMPENVLPIVPRYYWRTQTYEFYTGSSWFNPDTSPEDIASDQPLFALPESGYRVVHQEVTFSHGSGGQLYWTGTLMQANIPFEAAWLGGGRGERLLNSTMLTAYSDENSYTVDSLLPNVDKQMLQDSPAAYPDWISENYLRLPDAVPQRVRDLANKITISEATPYSRAIAIQNYLREFPYSLDVPAPPEGRDAADYFLFDLKKGYCDYFATTMVVMARSVGLPARLVLGYANGSYDSLQAKYFVAERDAHTWVEIYFANIGWVEFEPTSNQPLMEYAESTASTESDNQSQSTPLMDRRFIAFFPKLNWVLIALFFISIPFLWTLFDLIYLYQLEPARAIQVLYRRLRRFLSPFSGLPSPYETAHEFAFDFNQRVLALDASAHSQPWLESFSKAVDSLTELYSDSLFAPHKPSRVDSRTAIKLWHRLLLQMGNWFPLLIRLLKEKRRINGRIG